MSREKAKLFFSSACVAFGDILGIRFLVSQASEAVGKTSFLGLRKIILKSKSTSLGLTVLGCVK